MKDPTGADPDLELCFISTTKDPVLVGQIREGEEGPGHHQRDPGGRGRDPRGHRLRDPRAPLHR